MNNVQILMFIFILHYIILHSNIFKYIRIVLKIVCYIF